MWKFYCSFRLGLSDKILNVSFSAKDMPHALQRLTDFIAGFNLDKTEKVEPHIESLSLTAKRGVTYEEGWL